MKGYSLVIDISSDEENNRTSTPLKTLPLNTVGTLSDSWLNDLNEPPLADLDALYNLDLEDRQFSATARRDRGLKAMECPRQPPFLPSYPAERKTFPLRREKKNAIAHWAARANQVGHPNFVLQYGRK